MWKKPDETSSQSTSISPASPALDSAPRSAAAEPRRSSTSPAIIGESIRVQGEIQGDEDLLIEGEVDGQVHLDKHSVTVGRSGRVKADIHGGVLVVEGKVQGNLFAQEQAIVRASGEVRGNITSPRVSLEDGAKFKGSIDMEPRAASRAGASTSASTKEDSATASTEKGDTQQETSAGKSNGSGGSASVGGSTGATGGGSVPGGSGEGGSSQASKQQSGASAS